MKPLNPFTYLKKNPKKMMPIFFSVTIGVMLVYVFSLFSATTNKMISAASFDITDRYNIVYTEDNSTLPEEFFDKLNSYQISDVFPIKMNLTGLAYTRGSMGSTTISTFNLFDDDTEELLDSFNAELVEGSLPANNQNEILVPAGFALQNKLSIGDYIGTGISDEYGLEGTYKICGLTQSETLFAITCQPGEELKEQVMSKGIMYCVDGLSAEKQTTLLGSLSSNVVTITNNYYQQQYSATLNSMQMLTYILTVVMSIVLCIALGNLNVVMFDSRRNELTILYSIGFTKGKISQKLWKENLIVCIGGYLLGIFLTMILVYLYNAISLIPNGKILEIFTEQGLAVAFALPAFVSVFSLVPSLINNIQSMTEMPY